MESLVHGMLSNAAAVAVLAVLVATAGRVCRRPALIHSVCLLAMLKLVTPPVVPLPVPVPSVVPWPSAAPHRPRRSWPTSRPSTWWTLEPAEELPIAEDFDDSLLPEPPREDIAEAPAPPAAGTGAGRRSRWDWCWPAPWRGGRWRPCGSCGSTG